MKLSELIKKLQETEKEIGDCECHILFPYRRSQYSHEFLYSKNICLIQTPQAGDLDFDTGKLVEGSNWLVTIACNEYTDFIR